MFPNPVLAEAGHLIYSSEFADALEHRGGTIRGEITGQVPCLSTREHLRILRPKLRRFEKALGATLPDIFRAGGIPENKWGDALGDLFMGIRGHGVSIQDDYFDEWDKGCTETGAKLDYPHDEFMEYSDLAHCKLDESGYPPEQMEGEETEPDPTLEPIIETAFSWHGGQETALYAFASTRKIQSKKHRANTLAEIDKCIRWHRTNAEQSPGDKKKLRRLRKAVLAAKMGIEFFYA